MDPSNDFFSCSSIFFLVFVFSLLLLLCNPPEHGIQPMFFTFQENMYIYIFISLYRVLSKREREINKNQSTEKDHCSDTENKVRTLNYKQPPLSLSLFWVCLYILKYWFFKIKKKKVLQIVTFTFSFFVILFFFFFFNFDSTLENKIDWLGLVERVAGPLLNF